jgi:hypothetical protein
MARRRNHRHPAPQWRSHAALAGARFFRQSHAPWGRRRPVCSIDSYRVRNGADTGDKVSVFITMTASYQLSTHWLARASWNRVLTGYNKDSDIFLAGVGYRF